MTGVAVGLRASPRESVLARTRIATRAATTPLALFLCCLGGMLAGLLIDTRSVHPDALIALCTSADSFFARWLRDWIWMPATHALMLAAAVVASLFLEHPRPRARVVRICAHGTCLIAMVLGMAIGGQFALHFSAALGSGFAGLFAAMAAGMAGGMVLTVPFYRHGRRYLP
ncbi:MAG TPA: hypothetical protein VGQ93_01230 [Lysobacter sp.]|jgi:hypothetical protein|nr:hypothetical protein [Lysobacter sp.]